MLAKSRYHGEKRLRLECLERELRSDYLICKVCEKMP